MSIHHMDGSDATVLEWNLAQAGIATNWQYLKQRQETNELLSTWTKLFAAAARKACDDYGVSLETFEAKMAEFQRDLTPHIDRFKYYLSEQVHHEVDVQRSIEQIEVTVQDITTERKYRTGVLMSVFIPAVKEGSAGQACKCFFPIYSKPDDPHLVA